MLFILPLFFYMEILLSLPLYLCWDVAADADKLLQPCPTLCDPIDSSSPGFSISGIFQARTLEWVAISFSNAWKWKVKVKSLSHVRLFLTPWTAAYQAPLSMGFSRKEYWRWGAIVFSGWDVDHSSKSVPFSFVEHVFISRMCHKCVSSWS